jgi:diguanylate cyclase (GGDEF)-like protein
MERLRGVDHPDVATILSTLAMALRATGRADRARPLVERALHLDQATYGANHPEVAQTLSKLALVLRDLGRPSEALPLVQRAIAINTASFGEKHWRVATDLQSLQAVLRDLGLVEAARAVGERLRLVEDRAASTASGEHTAVTAVTLTATATGARSERASLVWLHPDDPNLGKRFTLRARAGRARVGRGADSEIVVAMDSVSRVHAHVEPRLDGWFVVDQGSTNGTYVNDHPVSRDAPLQDGDRLRLGGVVFGFRTGWDLDEKHQRDVAWLSEHDGLLQIRKRAALAAAADAMVARGVVLVLVSVDRFSILEGGSGGTTADSTLAEVTRIVEARLAAGDVLGRTGRAELGILRPGAEASAARPFAEALLDAIRAHVFSSRIESFKVTVSLGIGPVEGTDHEGTPFDARARQALERARSAGGDRLAL